MPSRRRVLSLAGAATASALAGCVVSAPTGEREVQTDTSLPFNYGDLIRGNADPIALGEPLDLTETGFTYLPDEHAVQHPTEWDGAEAVAHETTPFEEFAMAERSTDAAITLSEYFDRELSWDRLGGVWVGDVPGGSGISVTHLTIRTPGGELAYRTPLLPRELADVTPSAVRVRLAFTTGTVTYGIPVFVEVTGTECGGGWPECPDPSRWKGARPVGNTTETE
jgi:hypothetical protein